MRIQIGRKKHTSFLYTGFYKAAMLLRLDFSGDAPIYQQIRDQVVAAIASGELRPGERLPTIRALAEECGINMMTEIQSQQHGSTSFALTIIMQIRQSVNRSFRKKGYKDPDRRSRR